MTKHGQFRTVLQQKCSFASKTLALSGYIPTYPNVSLRIPTSPDISLHTATHTHTFIYIYVYTYTYLVCCPQSITIYISGHNVRIVNSIKLFTKWGQYAIHTYKPTYRCMYVSTCLDTCISVYLYTLGTAPHSVTVAYFLKILF